MPEMDRFPVTVSEQGDLLRTRQISPVELTRWYLERIGRLQPRLNAYITVTEESALEEARQAEIEIGRGRYRGALHGIPISYKDLIATQGIRTTAGSKIFSDHVPAEDAVVTQRLKAAGCICLGKTNLHEFAFGVTSNNTHYGAVRNPWNSDWIPGGSSGGSAAAVVAALCAASVGTDTGGSIRIPASACGCVGLKPTFGRVSCHGVVPLSWSMDHVGPITRTVTDAAILLDAIAGHDPRDPAGASRPPEAFAQRLDDHLPEARIGVSQGHFFEKLHGQVHQAVQQALQILGSPFGGIREVTWLSLHQSTLLGTVIAFAEASAYHEEWVRSRPEDYSTEILPRLRMGMMFLATDYLRCQRLRNKMLQEAAAIFQQIDVLVYPTLPFVGARIGDDRVHTDAGTEDVRSASIRLNRPANLLGYPAISIPCGFSSEGMPIGLQLMAAPLQEKLLLQVARFYESQTDWHLRRPPRLEP